MARSCGTCGKSRHQTNRINPSWILFLRQYRVPQCADVAPCDRNETPLSRDDDVNDPSHICGRRDILQEVAQKAIDLDFDGLIIESHIDPDKAWSDAKQQITPERLGEMIGSIKWRKEDVASEEYHAALEKLRQADQSPR